MKEKNRELNLPPKAERHKLFGSVAPVKGSKPTSRAEMIDLQNKLQDYFFPLEKVGITKVEHPVTVQAELEPRTQTSIGSFTLTTSLIQDSKGINMSRLTELLDQYHDEGWSMDLPHLCKFTEELAERMKQNDAEIEVNFPWFFERKGPSEGLKGLMHAKAIMKVSYSRQKGFTAEVGLSATVTTLCPCSKEISEYSAHNQRGIITMMTSIEHPLELKQDWKVALLHAAESNASAMIHPVLKRPDEKAVTEHAYENPRFVEDMVRLIGADLFELDFVSAFTVECRNEESIHLHDAIAKLSINKADYTM